MTRCKVLGSWSFPSDGTTIISIVIVVEATENMANNKTINLTPRQIKSRSTGDFMGVMGGIIFRKISGYEFYRECRFEREFQAAAGRFLIKNALSGI